MLRALGRDPYRPAHIHFVVSAPRHAAVTTHLFVKGDAYLDSDAVFGTKESLVVDFVRRNAPEEAKKHGARTPCYTVEYDFVLRRVAELPPAAPRRLPGDQEEAADLVF
ncbi:MAG: hypothetical protein HY332_05985 [Chloroflexi bacterium]|nr:hypothetical protein [Chloroflexota bacterium]